MENSKEKDKSNVVVIVLLSVAILLLLVVSTILLISPATNKSILVNGKNPSNIEEHSSNKKLVEDIPVNNYLYINNDSDDNSNNINQSENNVAINNSIPNSYGGEDVNSIPNAYGGEDIVKDSKTIKLNNVNHTVEVSCTCKLIDKVEYSPNQYYFAYSTSYILTIDGKKCKGIEGNESILPDNPKPSDCFTITKIADQSINKEYFVIQTFSHWISGTNVNIFIINNDLEILGSVEHTAGTTFSINGSVKKLELYSDYISDYTWDNEGVAHHVYSIQNGKFIDNIERVYKDGEYEAAGRT